MDLRWGEHDRDKNGSMTCIAGHINLDKVAMNTKAKVVGISARAGCLAKCWQDG